MRRIIGLILFAFLPLIAGCQKAPISNPPPPPPHIDWTITVTWFYDWTNYVQCSATVTKGCVSSFTWGFVQGTNQVPLKTSPPTVCTGTAQPQICSDTVNQVLGIGPTVFYVTANGIDNNGAAVKSNQNNSASQEVKIGDPTNVSATLK